jgi:phosphoribosylaminoimidazolecarboxamide formyltransferase/IMP cyclohydrolase
MDPSYTPDDIETRQIYGLYLQQPRNSLLIDEKLLLSNIVTTTKDIPETAKTDLILASIVLKFTQSNSVCYAHRGQVVGLGAGQQSRIHCTRLAGDKADNWRLRHHPRVLGFKWKKEVKRPNKSNAIDLFVSGEIATATPVEKKEWESFFEEVPVLFTTEERENFISANPSVSLSSDAFFPFSDNIHRARRSGVKYIVAPGGSVNDPQVIAAADGYGMVLGHTTTRLFHH